MALNGSNVTGDKPDRDELELAYRAAADRVIQLHNRGPENGAPTVIWAQAIRDSLELHE
jgi:hypothetical protein